MQLHRRGDRPRCRFVLVATAAGALAAATLAGCGQADPDAVDGGPADPVATSGASDEPIIIYSGRSEELVGGLLDRLEEVTGIPVEVRFASTAELAAQLLEEGDATPADLFFSQDGGALGALGSAGLLAELPSEVLDRVPTEYQAGDGTWVATSARARVVAYDPAQVDEAELPTTFQDLVDPVWTGQVGYAPTNASWHAYVTALRVIEGEDGARDWLTAFAANDPVAFGSNDLVLAAVNDGQIALGLVNHYYLYALTADVGEDAVTAKLHYITGEDPAGLVNVAGIGVLAGSDANEAALAAAEFLLSDEAQQYFADETAEYPVVDGITSTVHDLPPLDSLQGPDIDLSDLASLEETLTLLQEVGLS